MLGENDAANPHSRPGGTIASCQPQRLPSSLRDAQGLSCCGKPSDKSLGLFQCPSGAALATRQATDDLAVDTASLASRSMSLLPGTGGQEAAEPSPARNAELVVSALSQLRADGRYALCRGRRGRTGPWMPSPAISQRAGTLRFSAPRHPILGVRSRPLGGAELSHWVPRIRNPQ